MTAQTDRAAHTPGPWVAGEPDGSYHDVIRIYPETDTDQEKPIAVCFQQNSAIMEVIRGATNETTVAAKNAALIAAAPDGLDFAKRALAYFNGDPDHDDRAELAQMAEDYLAKAEGRQS